MPSDLIQCSDPTAAYVLNRAVWIFGSFVDRETDRYRNWSASSSESTGGRRRTAKRDKEDRRTIEEVREYRRALIEQTPFQRQATRQGRKMKLSEFAKQTGGGNGSRRIVHEPGKPFRVEG